MKYILLISLLNIGCNGFKGYFCPEAVKPFNRGLSWKRLPVKITIDKTAEKYRKQIENSIYRWNSLYDMELLTLVSDGQNRIYFPKKWKYNYRIIALAMVTHKRNRIIKANIIVNPIFFVFTDRIDFESVIMHELGHVLGLGHRPERGSIMFPYTQYNEIKREFSIGEKIKSVLGCKYGG